MVRPPVHSKKIASPVVSGVPGKVQQLAKALAHLRFKAKLLAHGVASSQCIKALQHGHAWTPDSTTPTACRRTALAVHETAWKTAAVMSAGPLQQVYTVYKCGSQHR